MLRQVFRPVSVLFAACCGLVPLASALAGGGPENVLLVVNSRSGDSLTIANHYAKLRQIPVDNLLWIPWDPKAERSEIDVFREKILVPALRAIQERRLTNQIDYIVYSSDFPWGIGLDSDTRKFAAQLQQAKAAMEKPGGDLSKEQGPPKQTPWPKVLTPIGSLTGLTYLWQPVVAASVEYYNLESNGYMRQPDADGRCVTTAGFRGNRRYTPKGEVAFLGGQRYFLSTMLGVTTGRGNSLVEVLGYLERSAAADGTHPNGTIYFMQNGDVRSRVRQGLFPGAVRELKQLGVRAEIVDGTVPMKKPDVQGAVVGIADFNWKASGSTILPGAICEHFTSYGGILAKGYGQTPLSEFLRYGAAGAGGTVVEPYAIPNKFPTAMIQVHYARGCTLAEAFYQSIHAPYQYLIVGDPLCRPWAEIPAVSASGVDPGATVHGPITIRPSAVVPRGGAVDHFELFADGRRMAVCKPGEPFSVDTTAWADGYHELRIVAVGLPPIESQGRLTFPIRTANRGRKITAAVADKESPRADRPLTIAVRSPGSTGILVMQGNRTLGRIAGAEGRVVVPAGMLGAGPVQLRAVGLGDGNAASNVAADPLELTIEAATDATKEKQP